MALAGVHKGWGTKKGGIGQTNGEVLPPQPPKHMLPGWCTNPIPYTKQRGLTQRFSDPITRECLQSTKPWVLPFASHRLDVVAYVRDHSTQGVETGGLGVQGHLWLHSGFETSLGYLSTCVSFPWILLCVFFCVFFHSALAASRFVFLLWSHVHHDAEVPS